MSESAMDLTLSQQFSIHQFSERFAQEVASDRGKAIETTLYLMRRHALQRVNFMRKLRSEDFTDELPLEHSFKLNEIKHALQSTTSNDIVTNTVELQKLIFRYDNMIAQLIGNKACTVDAA